ncbi:MAG: hypothetical protein ACYC8S_02295 [Minisyncoccota bacterium]
MSKTILVTDSLFVFPEHEKVLRDAGYEIERLDKPIATEEELMKAVKGKVGYILGGIEKVTNRVVEEADELKAIVFTGSDWKQFMSQHPAQIVEYADYSDDMSIQCPVCGWKGIPKESDWINTDNLTPLMCRAQTARRCSS